MVRSLKSYAPVQIFSAISLFALIAIQTRFLSVEVYGLLSVYLVLVELLRSITSQWLNASLLRLYPSAEPKDQKKLISTALALIWLLLVPVLALLAIGLFLYKVLDLYQFSMLTLLLVFKSLFVYYLELARLTERANIYRYGVLTQSILAIVFSALIMVWSPSFAGAVSALCLSYMVALSIVYVQVPALLGARKILAQLISYGFPLLVAGLMSVLNARIDRFVIADRVGLVETGLYSAISNMLLGIMSLVFMVIALPIYPDLTKLTGTRTALERKHSEYLDLLMLVSLPALVGLCFVAEPLIKLFLTEDYLQEGVQLFWILSGATFLINLKGHYFDHGLQFTLKTNYLAWISGFCLLLNVLLLSLLIDDIGIYAAAWILVAVNLIGILASGALAVTNGYQFSVGPNFGRIILSVIIMSLSLIYIKASIVGLSDISTLLIMVVSGSMVYGLALWMLDVLTCRTRAYVSEEKA